MTFDNRDLTYCDRCDADTVRDDDGACLPCRVRERGENDRERKRKAELHDRARLGLDPARRGRNLVRLCVDSGLYWCAAASRAGAPLPDVVVECLTEALQELER